jgi:hypothetical protein
LIGNSQAVKWTRVANLMAGKFLGKFGRSWALTTNIATSMPLDFAFSTRKAAT